MPGILGPMTSAAVSVSFLEMQVLVVMPATKPTESGPQGKGPAVRAPWVLQTGTSESLSYMAVTF